MFKRLFLGVVVAGAALAWPLSVHAQSTQDFTINDFTADYFLDRAANGTAMLHTLEQITAQFPNFDQNHGILRAIPATYLGHTASLSIDSVTDGNGQPLHFSTSHQNDNLVLKIGNADTYVHGIQVYKITYDQRNIVDVGSAKQFFNWDVNGDQWSQQFKQVTARLHVAPALVGSLQARRDCYVGYVGSTDTSRCTVYSIGSSGSLIITAQATNLTAGETMTLVTDFKAGTFKLGPEIARERTRQHIELAAAAILLVLPALIAGAIMHNRWRNFGDDPKGRGVIIPEYEPPKNLDPLLADFILKEQFRSRAFSALLIYLATRKHIIIYEIPKKGLLGKTDYELELKDLPADLSAQSKSGLQIIFGDELAEETKIKVSDLKQSSVAYANAQRFQKLSKSLSSNLTGLGYFIKDPLKIRQSYRTWALLIALLGGGAMWLFGSLAGGRQAVILVSICAGLGLWLAAAVMFGFSFIMPARSLAGVEARDELRGLKDYIKLAEADRLKFLQSPAGAEKVAVASLKPSDPKFKVKLFESLLPYAMLFELEKDWAKQFKDIYTTPPDWYHGNWSTFNAVYLANSVGGFSSASSVSFSTPSSSGGGGGGAGGGGGGGGGGGW